MKTKIAAITMLGLAALLLFGCTQNQNNGNDANQLISEANNTTINTNDVNIGNAVDTMPVTDTTVTQEATNSTIPQGDVNVGSVI